MPVIDFSTDVPNRTITITARFAAPVARVWELYTDPRQIEQIWGPREFAATFVEHDIRLGGRSSYYMTGPDGARYGGWWQITGVEAPHRLEFDDGFADEDLRPLADMPVSSNVYTFEPDGEGTRLVTTTTYATAEGIEKVIEMGVEEGTRSAMSQIDDFLATH